MIGNPSLTYWRTTGNVYAGDFTHAEPIHTTKPIAKLKKSDKQIPSVSLQSPKLIAKAKELTKNPDIVSAAEGDINAESIVHLQQVQLVRQVAGLPDNFFHLDGAYKKVNVPMLELREPYMGVGSTVEYVEARGRPTDRPLQTSELKYDLQKLYGSITFAIENIIRAVINPQTVSMDDMVHDYASTRNLRAANAIAQTVTSPTGTTTDVSSIDVSALATGGFHSANRVASKLSEHIGTFTKQMRVKVTKIAMHPKIYAAWTENTWTTGGFSEKYNPQRFPDGGVVSLPGLPNITGVVDLDVPDDYIYCFSDHALRLGQGPMFTETYKDYQLQTNVINMIDFVDYINADAHIDHSKIGGRYFGFRVPVTTT